MNDIFAGIIDWAPTAFFVVALLMLMHAMMVASAESVPPRIMRGFSMLFSAIWLSLAPSIAFEMGGLNKEKLSTGKYLMRQMALGQNSELVAKPQAEELRREDSLGKLPEDEKLAAAAKANIESGAIGQEGESSAHAKTQQPKPLQPTPAAQPATAAPIIEKLASPEEARSAADAKALWEVCLGVAIALGAGAAAWIAGKRKRVAAPAEALPDVHFLGHGEKAAFGAGDIFTKTGAFDNFRDGRG